MRPEASSTGPGIKNASPGHSCVASRERKQRVFNGRVAFGGQTALRDVKQHEAMPNRNHLWRGKQEPVIARRGYVLNDCLFAVSAVACAVFSLTQPLPVYRVVFFFATLIPRGDRELGNFGLEKRFGTSRVNSSSHGHVGGVFCFSSCDRRKLTLHPWATCMYPFFFIQGKGHGCVLRYGRTDVFQG